MAGAIRDMLDESWRPSSQVENSVRDVDIAMLAAATEVIDLSCTSSPERGINTPAMVMHMDPIAYLQPISIDR
jgi:hypothetical protein